jgi:1-acyl-sn-glycerol-3-phosphate acyltransferase
MIARFIERLLIASVRLFAKPRGAKPSCTQRIYVANHSSHLDAVLLMSTLPAAAWLETRPVAAAEYWNAGPVRRYLTHSIFRAVLVGRQGGPLNPLEPVADALRQGDSLIFFPEGTRGAGGTLQPLKPGIFHLARWFPEIEIVPAWIDNSYRILPKGFKIPIPLVCSIAFGEPLHWKEGQLQDEFLDEVRMSLEALHAREHN